jgi:hypothetical protein
VVLQRVGQAKVSSPFYGVKIALKGWAWAAKTTPNGAEVNGTVSIRGVFNAVSLNSLQASQAFYHARTESV